MGKERMRRFGRRWSLWLLGGALAGLVLLSFTLGRYPVRLRELLGILLSRVTSMEPFWEAKQELVVLGIRMPRILTACLVGAGLSAAGAAYQGVFQNAMASPDLLGASSGAAFGAALAILWNRSGAEIALYAFACSLLCVGLSVFAGGRARGNRTIGLVLSGIVVGSLFSAGTSFVKLAADTTSQLPAITYWLMGSMSGVTQKDLLFAFVPMIMGLIPLLLLRWRINVLTLGDDEAATMGVNAKAARLLTIFCATLVTAASVSVSGMIGWVGLVVPHMARRMVGDDYRKLMPASILLGAIFLLAVDDLCRNLLATEIPIGILTSFVGAPFFLALMVGKEENA